MEENDSLMKNRKEGLINTHEDAMFENKGQQKYDCLLQAKFCKYTSNPMDIIQIE